MSQIIQYFSEAGTGTVTSVSGGHDINISGNPAVNPTVNLDNAILLGDLSVVLAGNPSLTLTSGDLTISGTGVGAGGNLNLPATISANVGVVEVGGGPWLHSFGGDNIFLGASAGNFTATTANFNIGIGQTAVDNLTTGDDNVGVGVATLTHLTSSRGNTAIGTQALNQVDQAGGGSSNFNTAVGWHAGFNLETGSNNTLIGAQAGEGLVGTGEYNIVIGTNSGSDYLGGEDNNICIGNIAFAGDNNIIRIGTQGGGVAQQNSCFIAGIAGVTTSNSEMVTIDTTTGELGSVTLPPDAFAWSVITVDQSADVNNGYICNKAGLLTLTLPTTSAVGDIIEVTGMNTDLGWKIAQNANQIIHFGAVDTTTGVGGSLASTLKYDGIRIVCNVANLEWIVLPGTQGNITVV